jgi:hypothetical protein
MMVPFLVICIGEVIEVGRKVSLKFGKPVQVRDGLLIIIEVLKNGSY